MRLQMGTDLEESKESVSRENMLNSESTKFEASQTETNFDGQKIRDAISAHTAARKKTGELNKKALMRAVSAQRKLRPGGRKSAREAGSGRYCTCRCGALRHGRDFSAVMGADSEVKADYGKSQHQGPEDAGKLGKTWGVTYLEC